MEKKLKTLNEHDSERLGLYYGLYENTPKPNGIGCPQCGEELVDSMPNITLTSLPPKKDIHCPYCDFRGYRLA